MHDDDGSAGSTRGYQQVDPWHPNLNWHLNVSPAKMWTVTISGAGPALIHANFMEASKEQLRLKDPRLCRGKKNERSCLRWPSKLISIPVNLNYWAWGL